MTKGLDFAPTFVSMFGEEDAILTDARKEEAYASLIKNRRSFRDGEYPHLRAASINGPKLNGGLFEGVAT